MNFLEQIVNQKKALVAEAKEILSLSELTSLVSDVKPRNNFKDVITRRPTEPIKVIAEIKRASPSKGIIAEDIDPVRVAKDYKAGGASAISVLTENVFFRGSTKDFQSVREAVPDVPLLRKDFIIDEYQIYESMIIGADAILLIAAALQKKELEKFVLLTKECGMSALVEVHTEDELETALSAGAEIVGVNNRNLVTFKVSPEVSERLARKIPPEVVSVSESGISAPSGMRAASESGYHAVLIGEHFMRAANRVVELQKFTRLANYAKVQE
ncbi:MAG: indole-3-glycerol phosphate synthase TrpC [Bacteroidetes bacterium]|nr:indole-3-glycerol phosphate synthase TrpC [Bacteroidota bacterium]